MCPIGTTEPPNPDLGSSLAHNGARTTSTLSPSVLCAGMLPRRGASRSRAVDFVQRRLLESSELEAAKHKRQRTTHRLEDRILFPRACSRFLEVAFETVGMTAAIAREGGRRRLVPALSAVVWSLCRYSPTVAALVPQEGSR